MRGTRGPAVGAIRRSYPRTLLMSAPRATQRQAPCPIILKRPCSIQLCKMYFRLIYIICSWCTRATIARRHDLTESMMARYSTPSPAVVGIGAAKKSRVRLMLTMRTPGLIAKKGEI